MKKLVESLTIRQKSEIKSIAVDFLVNGDYNTPTECWIAAVVGYLKTKGMLCINTVQDQKKD